MGSFTEEEKAEIREIVGGTPLEDLQEESNLEDNDVVPFVKVTDNGTTVSKEPRVIKAMYLAGSGGGGTGDVRGVKLGNNGTTRLPNAQGIVAFSTNEMMVSLGTGSGTTKFLREDGSWATPSSSGNAPEPSSSTPLMDDGNGAAGSSTTYARGDHKHPSDTSRVPTTRKVNGKALSEDITLDAEDVGALPSNAPIPENLSDLSDDSAHRLVTDTEKSTWNGKQDTIAFNTTYNPSTNKAATMSDIPSLDGYVPNTRKVNGKALTSDISLNADDVGALPESTEIIPRDTTGLENYYTKTATDSMLGTLNTNVGTAMQDASDAKDEAEQVRAELNAKQLEVGAVETDSAPTKNSTNFVNSGAIFDYIARFAAESENGGFKMPFVDKDGNLIFGLTIYDEMRFFTDAVFENVTVKSITDLSKSTNKSEAYTRNQEKAEILENDALVPVNGATYGNGTLSKRLQLMIVTDTHLVTDSFKNATEAAQDFLSVDAIIHLGDFANNPDYESDNYSINRNIIDAVIKPIFMTPGNHDAGTGSTYVKYCKSQVELYERFIKPSVDKGFLKSGEYVSDKCYYYHDFDNYNLRLIMLYPFDSGDDFDTTYWEPVSYNASNPNLEARTYQSGEDINIPGHTKHSFRCVQNVTVQNISSPFGYAWTGSGANRVDYHYEYNPRYKTVRYYSWYKQEQLNWLVAKLNEAKLLGYTVILAQHYPILYGGNTSLNARYATETRFHNPYRGNSIEFEKRYASADINIIAQIADKFINGGTISKTVYPYGKKNSSQRHSDYENWGYDDATGLDPVVLNYSFDGGGKVLFLNGHNHSDCIAKSEARGMTQIGFLCGTLNDAPSCDVVRSPGNPKYADTMTALTLEDDKIHLTRLGIDTTIRVGSDGRLVRKDNEIITF